MIDDLEQVIGLIADMRANLPLAAETSPELASLLRRQSPDVDLPRRCRVVQVDYAGDEGGIVCRLDFGMTDDKNGYVVSASHIRVAGNDPLARAIAAYQRRRSKRLRRLAGRP